MSELAEVLGELMGIDTMGDDDLDGDDLEGMSTVGALKRRMRRRSMRLMPKPGWRKGQLAPGIQAPREGLEPLPLVADLNGGVFTALVPGPITFRARPQRPFRAERLLASVRRSGASTAALAAVTTGIFIGTELQQMQIGNYDLEFFGSTAFGVRLDLKPAEPGIDIGMGIQIANGAIGAAPDFIAVQLLLLGRSIA